MAAERLYTPRLLELATSLASFPLDPAMPLRATARSPSCGSTLELGLTLDERRRVARVGIAARSCAIGQAAAAIFAAAAAGHDAASVRAAGDQLASWLAGEGEMPAWPGIEAIASARDYPARHGAVTLAWRAASAALCSPGA